jgi:transposase
MVDRLSTAEVQAIIDAYHAGMIAKDGAAKFQISLSSVRRLLRKHGARRGDRKDQSN